MGRRVSRSFCWSISDFLRDLLVSFDFDFSDALLKGTSRSGPGQFKGWITLSDRINRYPVDK